MEGVVVAARVGTPISRFANLLRGRNWKLDLRSEDELVIESGEKHAYIIRDDGLTNEYDSDITRILNLVSNPIFFAIEFNDFDFGKEVLEAIADAPDLAVDNDHGEILRGKDFISRMRQDRGWDWRRSSDGDV
jgi:hypothetical protein